MCLFLIVFIGFRMEIGGDWINYLVLHDAIRNYGTFWTAIILTEPGYGVINYLIGGENGIYFVNAICAVIFCTGLYFFCSRLKYPIFSLTILLPYTVFVVATGYTRQATALGIIMVAYNFFVREKYKSFVLFGFLSLLFHKTGFIVLFLYPFKFVRKETIIKYVTIFFPIVILVSILVLGKFSYLLDIYGDNAEVSSAGGIYRHIMNVVPAMIFIAYHNFFYKESFSVYKLLWFLSVGSISLFFIGFMFSTLADRFGLYFGVIQMIVYPIFLNKFVFKDRLLVLFLIVIFYLIFMIYWFSTSQWADCCWKNYKNFLLN